MGNSSDIDISIASLYRAWRLFRVGKRPSRAIEKFEYDLEYNLLSLARELRGGQYRHGPYQHFTVNDTKRRKIAVATVRDRVVHRLLYEYLVEHVDSKLGYHVWSCRKGKGSQGAVRVAQNNMRRYQDGWAWRSDIKKFFASIDHEVMEEILTRHVPGEKAKWLAHESVASYTSLGQTGLAIGNLTSQIMGNMYLNEFDRFVLHMLKPSAYMRYGDDFMLWCTNRQQTEVCYQLGQLFLKQVLRLDLQMKSTVLQPVRARLDYLGLEMFPSGRRLNKRGYRRTMDWTSSLNSASYHSLIVKNMPPRYLKRYIWRQFGNLQ